MLETAQEKLLIRGEDPPGEPQKAQVLYDADAPQYDADAPQSFTFEVEDEDSRYEITQVFKGLPDEALIAFDRLREVSLEGDGKQTTDVKTNSVEADEYLFDELCIEVKGYDGDTPENWKALIPHDEKQAGINKLLAFKIVHSDKTKTVKQRSWGNSISSHTITLTCYFDSKILTTKCTFADKKPADIASYAVIRSRISLIEKGLDESALKIPASMKKKADFFDKLGPRVEGYDGRVPLHHKAAFVTAFFESVISSAEKK